MSASPQAESSDDVPASGYEGSLYILAFDHRGSFTKRFGIEGDPNHDEIERIADGKHLIFEGLEAALGRGADPAATGALVDEQFGGPARVPEEAKAAGIQLAMPVEKSGQKEFDFEYGDDFGAHIERYDPDFSKVLVRYNPEGDGEMNRRQSASACDGCRPGFTSAIASSSSSCWFPPARHSSPPSTATQIAMTPSCGPN